MKKLIILSVLVFASFAYKAADAQININISIGNQPEWGPAGYTNADYYYLPDIDVYYHISNRTYTYQEGNRWVTRIALPARYNHYNLYKGYKVVINEPTPWLRANEIRSRYASFRGRSNQTTIRDSRNERYTEGNDRNRHTPDSRKGNNRPEQARPQRRS